MKHLRYSIIMLLVFCVAGCANTPNPSLDYLGAEEPINDEIELREPIEDNVVYEKVSGVSWNTLPAIPVSSGSTVFNLNNVKKGVILVNAFYNRNRVTDNRGKWGGAGLSIKYKKGRGAGDLRVCSTGYDRTYPIWRGSFYTNVDCMIIVDDDNDQYSIQIAPIPLGTGGSRGNYEIRYLLLSAG